MSARMMTGEPLDRVDGRAKVTGTATFAAEFARPSVVHVVMVQSTVASGRIRRIDPTEAEKAPGVLRVFTHENMPRLHEPPKSPDGRPGEKLLPLQADAIHYDGQAIALVAADTFERATEAARLVRVEYEQRRPVIAIETAQGEAYAPPSFLGVMKLQLQRGDVDQALQATDAVKVDAVYETPLMHHNPMEPHASVAEWNGDQLTVWTATQGVVGYRKVTAAVLGVPEENVRIISPYVGGGFGCKGFVWPHPFLAAVVARELGRPAKLVHTRQQMFTANGHRPRTIQKLALAATREGKLTAIRHEVTSHTSQVDEFVPPVGNTSSFLYAAPNAEIKHLLTKLNLPTGCPTRAPGEAPGTYALEAAMDELAHALRVDPLELRLKNFAERHAQENKPWSSNYLRECYARGAEAFGWSRRSPQPRSMRDGRWLIGYGMATATYPAHRAKSAAKVQLHADGRVVVLSATQELGTGTYTILSQIAADALGVPIERVQCRIGDTTFPPATVSGGSRTAGSVGPAVQEAASELRAKLTELAGGSLPSNLTDVLRQKNLALLEAEATAMTIAEAKGKQPGQSSEEKKSGTETSSEPPPIDRETNADEEKYAFHSFGAQFAEVTVDPDLGEVRVRRVVSAFDVGRVLNRKTARSQVHGGVIMGVGLALMEESPMDARRGRFVARNLADYHVPTHADVPDIEVLFIDRPDPHFNALGCRGLGEIGITGITAAIANAVFHATGKRVRNLPITPDKLV